jgi:hypothetical protein
LVCENKPEPVAARLGESFGEPLWQVAELVELVDEAEERRPLRDRPEAHCRLPEPVGDHRADQAGGIGAEHALRQRADEDLAVGDDLFEVGRLGLAEDVAQLPLREERPQLVRERRQRLLALAGRELVPLTP